MKPSDVVFATGDQIRLDTLERDLDALEKDHRSLSLQVRTLQEQLEQSDNEQWGEGEQLAVLNQNQRLRLSALEGHKDGVTTQLALMASRLRALERAPEGPQLDHYGARLRDLERRMADVSDLAPERLESGLYTAYTTISVPSLATCEATLPSLVQQDIASVRIQVLGGVVANSRDFVSIQNLAVGHRNFIMYHDQRGEPGAGVDLSHPRGVRWIAPPNVLWTHSLPVRVRIFSRAAEAVTVSITACGRGGMA